MEKNELIYEVLTETFQEDVVTRSRELPVVLLCWATQIQESVDTKHTLERLAGQFQGKFALALMDVAKDPRMAQQLQIQGLPSIRVIVDGSIAGQLEGPQQEDSLRQMIEQITMSSGERLQENLESVLAARDWDQALAIIEASLSQEPNNPKYLAEQADVLICKGDYTNAQRVLDSMSADGPEKQRPQNRMELVQEVAGIRPIDELEMHLQTEPHDLEAIYEIALHHAMDLRYEEALDKLLLILQRDRNFRDDIGRTTMIRVMSLMPRDSQVAQNYRRQMFSLMH
ncbi:MAG: tetratricopeptide repeat protein [Gammaproteobacteria bacterium]|nr:tetratricopeptide repeat protein [Gammaproteobacteria bacterium]MYF38818.1 tetratricopeptide repeat protein [Gammaproteobacteria bacterium]